MVRTLAGGARAPDSVPLRRPAVADRDVPERVRHRAGQRRDAERGAAVHAAAHHPARGQGCRCGADRAAHRRRLARGRRDCRIPSTARVPATTAALVNLTHETGGRVIAVGTTVVRALESAADTYGHVEALRRLDRSRDHARARRAGCRRAHHRVARARGVAPADARSDRRSRPARAAPTTRRCAEGYLWHEFGDTHLIVP